LSLKFLRQRVRGTAVSSVRQSGRKKSRGQASNRAIQAVSLAGALIGLIFIGEDYQEIFVFAGLGLCSGVVSSIVQSRVLKARESS